MLAAGCGSSAERASEPAPPHEAVAPEPALPPPDPLRCELALDVATLGEHAEAVSAPVLVADGALVAYLRPVAEGPRALELVTRSVRVSDGALGAEQVVFRAEHVAAPRLVAHAGRAAVTVSARGTARLVPLAADGAIDPSASSVSLSAWPEAIALGPRGVVALPYGASIVERFAADGAPLAPIAVPSSPAMPEAQEELVASGAEVDLVLRRSGASDAPAIDAHVLADGEIARHPVARDAGVSVAAGRSGFLVVVSAPAEAWNDLALHFFDARGAPRGEVVHLSGPADGVRRYARAAPLGEGWAITFWDGVGPSLLRVDGAGRALAAPLPLRSGDERGGHTDARIATRDDGAIAITWDVRPPAFGHGLPEEQPAQPGARVALARCAQR